MAPSTRIQVVLPKTLLDEMDRLVGPRLRRAFLAETAEKELRRRRLDAAKAVAGSLADVDIPGWETSESAVVWVRQLRAADAERLEQRQR